MPAADTNRYCPATNELASLLVRVGLHVMRDGGCCSPEEVPYACSCHQQYLCRQAYAGLGKGAWREGRGGFEG
jgi:hypothetical protein